MAAFTGAAPALPAFAGAAPAWAGAGGGALPAAAQVPQHSHRAGALTSFTNASGGVLERLGLVRFKIVLATIPVIVAAMLVRLVLEQGFNFQGIILDSVISAYTWPCMLAIGILLQGVMEDYKEAERLPGAVAVVFDSLAERIFYLAACDARDAERPAGAPPALDARALHAELLDLLTAVFEFFAGLRGASECLALATGTGLFLTDAAARVNGGSELGWEIWASVEALRGTIMRQAVIRRTDFLPAGSLLIKCITYSIVILYVLAIYTYDATAIDQVYYGTVYVSIGINCGLFSYLLFLTEDLDDPYEYSLAMLTPAAAAAAADDCDIAAAARGSDEIDTFPLLEVYARLTQYASGGRAGAGAPPRVAAIAAAIAAARPGGARAPSVLSDLASDAPPAEERRAFRRLLAASMRSALSGSGRFADNRGASWHAPNERHVSTLRRYTRAVFACVCVRDAGRPAAH